MRSWFRRLTRIQRLLAAVVGLIVTIGAVATAITAVLELHDRLASPNKAEKASAPAKGAPHVFGLHKPGVRVIAVVPGSPADHAGVRVGDVITGLRGRKVEDVDDFRHILKQARPGDIILINLFRRPPSEGGFSFRSKFLRAKLQRTAGSNLLLGLQVEDVRPERGQFARPPSISIDRLVVLLTLLSFFMTLLAVGFFWLKGKQGDGNNSGGS
jgi:membrane-associated protease RseP (regulator of RpoE activity)